MILLNVTAHYGGQTDGDIVLYLLTLDITFALYLYYQHLIRIHTVVLVVERNLDVQLTTQLYSISSLSYTEQTAYTVGHPCKSYMQPNQPWPDQNYNRADRVYPSFQVFETLKQTWNGCCVRVWSYKRSYKTVRERVWSYKTEYITVHKVHFTSVHIRFSTIAVRPIQFEQYMDTS